MRTSTLLLALLCICSTCIVVGATLQHDLKAHILNGYDADLRPIKDPRRHVNVNITMFLLKLIDLDAISQTFTVQIWLQAAWYDEHVTWNPAQFSNITSLSLPGTLLWIPDLIVVFSAPGNEHLLLDKSSRIQVFPNGRVIWSNPHLISCRCPVNITKFPFDEQSCEIHIKPSADTYSQMHLQPFYISQQLEEDERIAVTNVSMVTMEQFGTARTVYTFSLKRRPQYYLWNLIAPFIGLLAINGLQFCVPVDSGERLSFVVTLLLSLMVFQLTLVDGLPKTSLTQPIIMEAYYICLSIAGVFLIGSVLVLRIQSASQAGKKPPAWLKSLSGSISNFRVSPISITKKRNPTIVESMDEKPEKSSINVSTNENAEQETGESDVWRHVIVWVDRLMCGLYFLVMFIYLLPVYFRVMEKDAPSESLLKPT